jgi:hypothetical protein
MQRAYVHHRDIFKSHLFAKNRATFPSLGNGMSVIKSVEYLSKPTIQRVALAREHLGWRHGHSEVRGD